ncbi:MAG: FAD-binding oxidoreductase [Bacillota bacterium]|nr:FAD-binding oxidoreductase [Bacillota bacterium]MDI7248615.1 FAD-binding oxidoreductase [Bacillota bacterium]
METVDVVIVGGGIMGWCTAYNLLADGFDGSVLVLERDPLRRATSTSLAVGGFRQQFGSEINIRAVRYSVSVYENFSELMETPEGRPDISLRQRGYLFLAGEKAWPVFQRRYELQRRLGVEVSLLEPAEAQELVPELDLEGIAGATFCPRDGYLDPYAVLQGFEAKARQLGARCLYEEAVAIERDARGVRGLRTSTSAFATRTVVNAAGAWAGELARRAGLDLPVRPWRRQVYVCRAPVAADREFPMVVDTTGVHFRSETGGLIVVGGATSTDAETFDLIWDRSAFVEEIWPVLAARVPLFDTLRLENGWAGLYDENPIDHNAIVGRHPELPGFYLINGFSGHGLMQGPCAGKALAELIMWGEYRTVDLSPLSPARFAAGKLVVEEAVL